MNIRKRIFYFEHLQKRRRVKKGKDISSWLILIKDKKVPILELAYPTTRNDLINVIDRANDFLKNLTSINGIVNEDNLDADLKKHEGSLDYKEFKKILDDLIYY